MVHESKSMNNYESVGGPTSKYLYMVRDHNLHLRLEEVILLFLDQLFYKIGPT